MNKFHAWAFQNFPFMESTFKEIDNYHLMMDILHYLKEQLKDYQELVKEVEELEQWFNNLDVQEEINNKLEEMVESGELQEIISQYLNSTAIFAFDNVANMKSATNLINGSYAKTLGYYSKNDGGSSTYKIRTITNEDVVDEMTIIAMNDETLVAELIYGNKINIKQLGAKPEVGYDNTLYFEKALTLSANEIYIPNGIYEVGQLVVNGYHLIGGSQTTLQCIEECVTWIDIKTMSIIENIRFYGHHLADKITLSGNVQSFNITRIENCIFYEMNESGLESNTIEVPISNCSFHDNGIGLSLKNVAHMVTSCYAYKNNNAGFVVNVGTNTLSNCKSYGNGGYGFEILGDYITVSSCESQQNKKGSLLFDETTHNAIIDNINILGDSTILDNDQTQYPLIRLLGKDNFISGVIKPFHYYPANNWKSFPSCIIDSTRKSGSTYLQPTNNHIELKLYQASDSHEQQLKELYPSLSFTPIITTYNQGQSNKIIFNDLEYKNTIHPTYSNNSFPSRGTKVGSDQDDFIIKIPASVVNGMNLNAGLAVFQSNDDFDDELNLLPYYTGQAYPINYEGKVKAFVSMKFVGTVDGNAVVAAGDPSTGVSANSMESANSIYKNYVSTNIPYVNLITSKPAYEANSLKLRTNIEITKIENFVADEDLLIAVKNAKLINDNCTKLQ